MAKHKQGEIAMEALAIKKFNIRDTKKFYSDIFNTALKGLEVITYNTFKEEGEVSHIKKDYLDLLLDNLRFKPFIEYDEKLNIFTVAINEIDLYGEGETKEQAIEDLLDSILEYLSIYIQQIDIFSKAEPLPKQVYTLKLLRCNGDKGLMRKALGL